MTEPTRNKQERVEKLLREAANWEPMASPPQNLAQRALEKKCQPVRLLAAFSGWRTLVVATTGALAAVAVFTLANTPQTSIWTEQVPTPERNRIAVAQTKPRTEPEPNLPTVNPRVRTTRDTPGRSPENPAPRPPRKRIPGIPSRRLPPAVPSFTPRRLNARYKKPVQKNEPTLVAHWEVEEVPRIAYGVVAPAYVAQENTNGDRVITPVMVDVPLTENQYAELTKPIETETEP